MTQVLENISYFWNTTYFIKSFCGHKLCKKKKKIDNEEGCGCAFFGPWIDEAAISEKAKFPSKKKKIFIPSQILQL